MAKRKKTTSRRRRRSIGAAGGDAGQLLQMLAGAVLGRVVQNKLGANMNPKILAGGQIVLGFVLPKMIKSPAVKSIGAGMVINGGLSLMQNMGVISAISGTNDDVQLDFVAGSDIPVIAGPDELGFMDNEDDEGIMSGLDDLEVLAGMDSGDDDY